jgi:hypothetical protein
VSRVHAAMARSSLRGVCMAVLPKAIGAKLRLRRLANAATRLPDSARSDPVHWQKRRGRSPPTNRSRYRPWAFFTL